MQLSPVEQQVAIGAIVSGVIELFKRWSALPFISEHTRMLNRIISVVTAVLTSAGFSFALTGDANTGGVLTINFPAAIDFVLRSVLSFMAQEGTYRGLLEQRKAPQAVVGGIEYPPSIRTGSTA